MIRAAALLLATALGGLGPSTPAPESEALAPVTILARYSAALAKLHHPKAIAFDYSVEQLGMRNMEQTHHVYRSGLAERDETLVVDGLTLPRPSVKIVANRSDRYDIAAIAPTEARYTFAYTGSKLSGDDIIYVFSTERKTPASFAVSEIELDSKRFLPRIVHFKIAGYGVRGSGALIYGPAESYWVVRQAQVNAHTALGAPAHERITWSNYQFPPSLPRSTFVPPRPVVPILPEPAGTASPDSGADASAAQ